MTDVKLSEKFPRGIKNVSFVLEYGQKITILCFLAKNYKIFHFWPVFAIFWKSEAINDFFRPFYIWYHDFLQQNNQNKSINWRKLTFSARAKTVHKSTNWAVKIPTKMALDVLTPFFGSTFYNTCKSYYLCKKIQKINLRSRISKNLAINGSKRGKMVKFREKWPKMTYNSNWERWIFF